MSAQKPIRASTQEHLNVQDIQDNLLVLKDNSCCLVLKTTAINFGLLSEREQEATIYAYAGLLNSLTFSIQILIQSRQKDISSYLALIDQQLSQQKDEKLKIQTQKYRQFIESTVKKNKVLDKKFYIIIPFSAIQFKKVSLKSLLEKAKTDLYPKRDHLLGQLQRLGLKAAQLNSQELIELFFNVYNPEAEGQRFASSKEYLASFVQPMAKPQVPPPVPQPQPATFTKPKTSPIPPPPSPKTIIPKKEEPEDKFAIDSKQLQNKINNIVENVSGKPAIKPNMLSKIRPAEPS